MQQWHSLPHRKKNRKKKITTLPTTLTKKKAADDAANKKAADDAKRKKAADDAFAVFDMTAEEAKKKKAADDAANKKAAEEAVSRFLACDDCRTEYKLENVNTQTYVDENGNKGTLWCNPGPCTLGSALRAWL